MSEHKPRPRALVAIVIYKCFTIGLLICVAIGLFLTSKVKVGIFVINMAMLVYLLKHALEERKKRQRKDREQVMG